VRSLSARSHATMSAGAWNDTRVRLVMVAPTYTGWCDDLEVCS
jgi:hypothetical protein